MKDYYIEDDRADIEEFYIDTLDFDSEELDEIEDAFEDRKTYKIMCFMDSAIVEKIGMPPSGSGFDYDSNESDAGHAYFSLVFKYNPKKKSHNNYLSKIEGIIYEEDFFVFCNSVFEERYLAFLKEGKI
jgi:hypothetical protein